jgi:hypothetical protein
LFSRSSATAGAHNLFSFSECFELSFFQSDGYPSSPLSFPNSSPASDYSFTVLSAIYENSALS